MKILFICTHNRCRSILSEAICNHLSDGRIQAYSAGSQPVGQVHPLSIKYLQEKGIATTGLRSQSWDDFATEQPDIVVTVCDSAANESCPVWFGDTLKVHWPLVDPSKLNGSDAQVKQAFFSVMAQIEARIHALLALDLVGLRQDKTGASLQLALDKLIAEDSAIEGA